MRRPGLGGAERPDVSGLRGCAEEAPAVLRRVRENAEVGVGSEIILEVEGDLTVDQKRLSQVFRIKRVATPIFGEIGVSVFWSPSCGLSVKCGDGDRPTGAQSTASTPPLDLGSHPDGVHHQQQG